MKEIKLWEITTNGADELTVQALNGVNQTKTEEQLEEILVRSPELLMEDLKLVGRQTETPGGPLDLFGVDADGRLVVFELKRGTLMREAIVQIIDYASYLSELEPEELSGHISERSGNLGIEKIDSFLSWYQEQYAKSLSTPQKPRMVLVGLGADDRARRMISFLANSEIDISLVTFHAFEQGEKILLAKQVEVLAKSPPSSGTKKDNLEKLQQKVKNLGLDGYYYKMAAFFRDQLAAYEWPNPGGYSYYLPELTESGTESTRVHIALYIYDNHPGRVKLQIYGRATEAASDIFEQFREKLSNRLTSKYDGGAEIWVTSLEDWEKLIPQFKELCLAIVAGWKKKREQQLDVEFHETEKESTSEEVPERESHGLSGSM